MRELTEISSREEMESVTLGSEILKGTRMPSGSRRGIG